MEQHAGETAIQMCREVLFPSVERHCLLASLVCILFEGTTRGPCFYSNNVNMDSCKQEAVEEMYMQSRNSKNKQRFVCGPCRDWLVEESLASIAKHAPPIPVSSFCLVEGGADLEEGEIPREESVELQTPPKRAKVCSADLDEGEIPGEKSVERQTPPKRAKVCNMDA